MPKRRERELSSSDDVKHPVAKRSKQTLDQSTLKTYGFKNEPNIVIASMEHTRFKPGEVPRFKERMYTSKKKIYTAKHKELPTITFLGKEDDNCMYDYSLVKYNKTKKKVVDIQPASFLRFEGRTEIDPRELKGEKVTANVNYVNDYSIKSDDVADRRRNMISDFGSIQKNKMLDAHNRRTVANDTLKTLETTTFASKNAVENKAEVKPFEKVESEMMPRPNRDASSPAEIYSKTLFYSHQDVQYLGQVCIDFFKENNSISKLILKDIHKSIAVIALKILETPDDATEAVLMMKFLIYSVLVKYVTENRGRQLKCDELLAKFPPPVVVEVLRENFGDHLGAKMKINYSLVERDRLCIWLLCMWLVFNDYVAPLGIVTASVGLVERTSAKFFQGLGCQITDAKGDEVLKYQSMKIAKLVGPPPESLFKRNKRGRK